MVVTYVISPSLSWELPKEEFLKTFAHTLQIEGVNIFLPEGISRKYQVLSVMKHLRRVSNSIFHKYFIHLPICVFYIFSEAGISVIAMYGKMDKMNRNPKMLHVTAASPLETNSSGEAMKLLTKSFIDRKRSDRDIWLFGLDFPIQDKFKTENVYE